MEAYVKGCYDPERDIRDTDQGTLETLRTEETEGTRTLLSEETEN